ncbi:DUF3083 family protein [Thalassotalea ganghwensis]
MPISRSRNTQHKVYLPTSARSNQYIMVKFPVTESLIAKYQHEIDKASNKPYEGFYQVLSEAFFDINHQYDIESGQFIASDKYSRVRYSPERLTVETEQQILFLYNPRNHYGHNSYVDNSILAKNITLLFLANGDDVRKESAKFHSRVTKAVKAYSDFLGEEVIDARIRDHQHLTYDLFAKDKGVSGTLPHKFRTIKNRYAADDIVLPEQRDVLTYVVADIPVNRRIKQLASADKTSSEPFMPLYRLVEDAIVNAAKQYKLTDGAVLANGLFPFVRRTAQQSVKIDGDVIKLGFNPFEPENTIQFIYDGTKLVDSIRVIFVATKADKTSHGYGKFLNHVELALKAAANRLDYVTDKEELVIRVHQHLGYKL